ncbi:MAG: hypothetical protein KBC28_09920 [Alphaproteobacteria bacterium]|nr:hypothetical protein [Alphaproteobacteria bacterium]
MNESPSPLMQAYFCSQSAAQEGFDWDSPIEAARKVQEEVNEVLQELQKPINPFQQHALKEEIGDLFMACCCLARHCKVNPEEAIVISLKKFIKRYSCLKSTAQEKGISFQGSSAAELSSLWQQVKRKLPQKINASNVKK